MGALNAVHPLLSAHRAVLASRGMSRLTPNGLCGVDKTCMIAVVIPWHDLPNEKGLT